MKKLIVAAFILYSPLSFAQEVKTLIDIKPIVKSNSIVSNTKGKSKKNIKIVSKLDSLLKIIKTQQNKILVVTGSMKNKNKN